MTVTAPETAVRQRLRDALDDEFAPEEITFRDDKLHPSQARESDLGGVYPGPTQPRLGQEQMLEVTSVVQIYREWTPEVNPEQEVSPEVIEEWAERARRAIQSDGEEPDEHFWFASVVRTEYPPDPSGNISRVEITVLSWAQNSALVETSG